MSGYEKEADTSPEDSGKDTGGKVDLPPGFAPLAPPLMPSSIPPPRPPSIKPSDLSGPPRLKDALEESKALSFKPMLACYPVRKPTVTVALLDPTKVYVKKEESETIVPHDIPAPVSEGFLDETSEDEVEETAPEETAPEEKSVVEPRYPSIKPVALDREKIYPAAEEADDLLGDLEDDEGEVDLEEVDSADDSLKTPVVGFRASKVKPVMLEAAKVYQVVAEGEDVEDSGKSILDDIELTLDEESAFKSDDEDSSEPSEDDGANDSKPIVPDPNEVAELVAKKLQSSSEVQVLGPETPKREKLLVPEDKVSKWAFWKRPSKRDQQLARISEGYLEMVDLVRAIRGQLESQNENSVLMRETLGHLPEAMKGLDQGLDRFSKSQQILGNALGEIHTQMKTYSEKDERLAVSMDGFNDTLKGMDDTSKATMKTFDRVQERMRDSDIRMENLFQNVQNTEEKVSDTMVRLQRNMAVMQYIFLGCLMVVIGVLVFTVITKQDEPKDSPQTERVEPKPAFENE